MRNGIFKHGILIMAGALALGACGGRQNDQQTTAQPDVTDPAQPGTREGQGTTGEGTTTQDPTTQDPTGQDPTGQNPAGQDPMGSPTPDQHMTGQGMHGQDMHGQAMGQDQGMQTGTQGMQGQGMQGQGTQGQGMQAQGMQAQGTHDQMGHEGMAMECPTDVEGTTARTTQTKRGITIAFTTKGKDDVAEVRRRVQHLAEMHNQHHAQHQAQGAQGAERTVADQAGGQGAVVSLQQNATQAQTGTGQVGAPVQSGTGGQGQSAAANAMGTHDVLTMTQARAENMPRGARLVLTVKEPRQMERVREQLRIHAQNMAAGECDMMSGQGMSGQGTQGQGMSGQGTQGQGTQGQGTQGQGTQGQGTTPGKTPSQPAGQGKPGQPPTR